MSPEERQHLAQAIDAGLQPKVVFGPQTRGELLHQYAGMAMAAMLSKEGTNYFLPAHADEAVRVANETVLAVERFYTLAMTPGRGRG